MGLRGTMEESKESFSLLDEPWIRCQDTDGEAVAVGIRDVFSGDMELLSVRGDSPAQDYAVTRLLLAIFWRAHRHDIAVKPGQTFDFSDWFGPALEQAGSGTPDERVLEYLDEHADRFDLLHPETPFMQVADLHTAKGQYSDINRIVPEAENTYFTMRAGDAQRSLSLAEAARWLVYVQAYDYSGIKSGAVGDDRVKGGKGYPIGPGWSGRTGGTLVLGRTIRETLVLNTVFEAIGRETDKPVWERESDTAAQRSSATPQGPADLATWQSRRVRLFVEDGAVTGALVSNGDAIVGAGANVMDDPMTPYRYSRNKSKKGTDVYFPRPFDTERTVWQSLEPLILLESDVPSNKGEKPPKRPATLDNLGIMREEGVFDEELANLQLVSVEYGPQESSVATVVPAILEMPIELLAPGARLQRRTVIDAANATSQASTNLGSFVGQLAQASGGDYEFNVDSKNSILAELEPKFLNWLKTVDGKNYGQRAKEWQGVVRQEIVAHAQMRLRGAGPKALVGREEPDTEDKTRLISAGTAYRWLLRNLDESLPLTKREYESDTGRKEK